MVISHIRYLYSNATVCHEPERLGTELVITDSVSPSARPCRECSILFVRYNAKQQEDLVAMDLNEYNAQVRFVNETLSPSKGIAVGILISSIIWALMLVVFWMVWSAVA